MNEKEFYNEFDKLLTEHKIDTAKEYLLDSLAIAKNENNTSLLVAVLNETIGFFRDLSLFEDSIKFAKILAKLINQINNPKLHFISYINIANAYRAGGLYQDAYAAFNYALSVYENYKLDNKIELAALYNNFALLEQKEKNYDKALLLFNKALETIKNESDNVKLATTYINIAECYMEQNKLNEALDTLFLTDSLLINYQDDFHMMGYYLAYGKVYYLKKEYLLSEKYYKLGLAHIDKNLGRNILYKETLEEYMKVLNKLNKNRMTGIELSYRYYIENKELLFNNISNDTLNNLTIGLFGLGSECYYSDDYISEDHDFNPGFIVLCEDNVSVEEFTKLKENYNKLPKIFDRFYIREILPKHGIHYFKDYIFEFMGVSDINNLTTQNKSLLTNGKIFFSNYNSSLVNLRNKIIKNNKYDYLNEISLKALEISQYIPYNLKRSLDRNDIVTYNLLKNHLVDRLIEFYYIYHKEFMPHDKLSLKLMNENSIIYKWINKILYEDSLNDELIIKINEAITNELFKLHIINNRESLYIDSYREEIIEFVKLNNYKSKIIPKIVEIEWEMFQELNNIGCRASCQNNKPMFKLMRESQYYSWNKELLASYYNDLNIAVENHYNLLAIKYGFMEETVDPDHYVTIKDNLPKLSEKRIQLREGIVSVQLEMLNDYSKENDISNMRTINTISDKYDNASYETYLRGELSSYSENTMYLYAKYLTYLAKNKLNIVELTLFYTNLLR